MSATCNRSCAPCRVRSTLSAPIDSRTRSRDAGSQRTTSLDPGRCRRSNGCPPVVHEGGPALPMPVVARKVAEHGSRSVSKARATRSAFWSATGTQPRPPSAKTTCTSGWRSNTPPKTSLAKKSGKVWNVAVTKEPGLRRRCRGRHYYPTSNRRPERHPQVDCRAPPNRARSCQLVSASWQIG